jgi:hypothetical protein
MTAYFERFTLRLTKADALACSHQGACDDDVEFTRRKRYVSRQLAAIPSDSIAAELKGYGAWDSGELADREANYRRIIWLAAGDIREELQS